MKTDNKWTKKEIALLVSSIFTSIIVGYLCHNDLITIICSVVGISCVLMQAKGLVLSQFFGLIYVVLYSLISYKTKYFGEAIVSIFIIMPLFIYGIISWKNNVDQKISRVKPKYITKTEWIVLISFLILFYILFYYILKAFNTSQLTISTLSIIANILSTYLITRRSKFAFIVYMAEDLFQLSLWSVAVLSDITLIVILINPIVYFINDVYAWKSWKKYE